MNPGGKSKIVQAAMKRVKDDGDDKAKEFIEKVKNSKNTFSRIDRKFYENYKIDGKTMPEWKEHFKTIVERDADPTRCKVILADLADKYQEASFYYMRACALERAYCSEREKAYREAYTTKSKELVGGKTPASTTLQTVAANEVQDYDDVIYNTQIVKDFWKGTIEQLKYCYKLLNDITINSGYELKISKLGG